eukprot:4429440-Karenia_brevis.AAC.1
MNEIRRGMNPKSSSSIPTSTTHTDSQMVPNPVPYGGLLPRCSMEGLKVREGLHKLAQGISRRQRGT